VVFNFNRREKSAGLKTHQNNIAKQDKNSWE